MVLNWTDCFQEVMGKGSMCKRRLRSIAVYLVSHFFTRILSVTDLVYKNAKGQNQRNLRIT